MSTGLWGIGFSVVTARTRKLLKRLVASPMRKRDYLLGHLFGRLVFLVIEVGALVGFSRLVFGVPMRGSWLMLAATCFIGGLSFGGIGLLVASRARTVEAVSGLLNLVMFNAVAGSSPSRRSRVGGDVTGRDYTKCKVQTGKCEVGRPRHL